MDKNRKEASEFSVEISETVTKAAVREATEQLISIFMQQLKESESKNITRIEQTLQHLLKISPKFTQNQCGLLPIPNSGQNSASTSLPDTSKQPKTTDDLQTTTKPAPSLLSSIGSYIFLIFFQ